MSSETEFFGKSDQVEAKKEPKKKEEAAPVPARPVRYIVDEARDRAVTVNYSTVIFRPQQVLDSAHLVELAKMHGVLLREV